MSASFIPTRAITMSRKYGTLLIIDETHTICTGPDGYTRAHNLHPDFFVLGKPIASGLPAAAYGFTAEVGERILKRMQLEDCDTGGIGGTLAGNALSLAVMRATLERVLTESAFVHMIPLAERFAAGVEEAIKAADLPWHVTRLGCRAEYLFTNKRPHNGTEAAAAADFELERFMHLHALNRGILLTPFVARHKRAGHRSAHGGVSSGGMGSGQLSSCKHWWSSSSARNFER